MEITHTRISIGTQIREALDEMKAAEQIKGWKYVGRGPGEPCYDIVDAYGNKNSLLPGQAMSWLNRNGYDVRFGRA